jgi:hypothetical protein
MFKVIDTHAPEITITSPMDDGTYYHPDFLTLDFAAVDVGVAGLKEVTADLDGVPVTDGQVIDLYTLALGDHTLTVNAEDKAGNTSSNSATFHVTATASSLMKSVQRFYDEGKIDNEGIYNALMQKLLAVDAADRRGRQNAAANVLEAFINSVMAQSGKHIDPAAAELLIEDAQWILDHLP